MSITVVSSFKFDADYARPFVESLKHWPAEVRFRIYFHDGDLPEAVKAVAPPNVEFVRLEVAAPQLLGFRAKFAFADGTMGKTREYSFRVDAIKFANKSFAIIAEARRMVGHPTEMAGWLLWLDADTVTQKPIDAAALKSWLPPCDVVHLGRKSINYSETSYLAFNLANQATAELLADLEFSYVTGEIFGFSEFHDGFVLTRLMNLHAAHGLRVVNLTPHAETLDAFGVSPLAPYIVHYKGPTAKAIFAGASAPTGQIFAQPPGATPRHQPIRVIPQDCRPAPEIVDNIVKNTATLPQFIQRCHWHDDVAVIISGGPSWKQHLTELEMLASADNARRHRIICVKHSLPDLLDAGIVPWACVLLDPRDIEGTSTHGVKRRDLLERVPAEMWFFVASMTDPGVVEHLKAKNARIAGWHAYSNAAQAHKLPEGHFYITGGTSAAMRSVGICHTLGFREFKLFGYDSALAEGPPNWENEKDEKGRPKFLPIKVGENGTLHITTGELLAQAQDIEELLQRADLEMDVSMRSGGIAGDLAAKYPRPKLPNYVDLYGR